MFTNPNSALMLQHGGHCQSDHVVLVVEDCHNGESELNVVLAQNGYGVIETDNGQDAAHYAQQTHPDLLLIDLDVPLLYELIAARQIQKQSQLWWMPVVIVTHDEVIDSSTIMEVGVRRNEYVTRLSNYDHLQDLLDYLLPVLPSANGAVTVPLTNEFRPAPSPSKERTEAGVDSSDFWKREAPDI